VHNNNDHYWDGAYGFIADHTTLFYVKLQVSDGAAFINTWWHNQHTDVISAEHIALLDDLSRETIDWSQPNLGPTTTEAGFPKSLHRYLDDHVCEMHLKMHLKTDFMTLQMASMREEQLHLLVRCKGRELYVDDVLHPLYNALCRPEVFGQSFTVRKATIAAPPTSARDEILNAMNMGIHISERCKRAFIASIDRNMSTVNSNFKWYFAGAAHIPRDFSTYDIGGLNDDEDNLIALFQERMIKVSI